MPSSYSDELGIELQAAGENLNTWGQPKLNNALTRLTKSIAGFLTIALTADITLTSSNTSMTPADYQARFAALKFTGAGAYTVTIPSSAKTYTIWNACGGALTVTTGAGDAAALAPGEVAQVLCDATNVKKVKVTDHGSSLISTTAVPTAGAHLTNKSYVDGLAFAAASLPGQGPGTVGQVIMSDGTAANWATIRQGDVTDLTVDLAALAATDAANLTSSKALAIAFAVSL